MSEEVKILIGSAICQKSNILKEFLLSLEELDGENINISYCLVDDNRDEESSKILLDFMDEHSEKMALFEGYKDRGESYNCDSYTHYWTKNLVEKVTIYKNYIIDYFLNGNYTHLFLIDSDIVLHPKTLKRLISTKKDVISNIFWTKWGDDLEELPQVWEQDNYSFFVWNSMDEITKAEREKKEKEFIEKLKVPGTYRVGGLGACTLISRKVLEKGVNFSKLYNLSYWGEDRHFCMRAVANGFELFVDTYYPAYHIYREKNLGAVEEYKKGAAKRDLDILGEQLFQLAKEGIIRYKTYSFDESVDNSWELFFSDKVVESFKKKREKFAQDGKKNKLIKKINVIGCKMNLNDKLNEISGYIDFMEYGYKNEQSFYREKTMYCSIKNIKIGIWRIESLGYEEELEIKEEPFIRRVRENPKVVVSMIVRNEEDRYLGSLLDLLKEYINDFVIIDDCSDDGTVGLVEEKLSGKNLKMIKSTEQNFHEEWIVRKSQWDNTIREDPDWIFFLDADEFPEKKLLEELNELVKYRDVDSYGFRFYDMWNEDYYRDDKYWSAHNRFSPFLIRYQPNFQYKFRESSQHCGRMPMNILDLPSTSSLLRIKHMGWAKEEDRMEKYKRYKNLDPNGDYGDINQYESILDKDVNLRKWTE